MAFLRNFLLIALVGLQSSKSLALLSKQETEAFTLKNGMRVILHQDTSIPNANMYTFWRVGSRNEVPGITGLSHFFEHMMFNGSRNYPPGSFDKIMEAAGGSNNAYTNENLTVYTNWFTAKAFETVLSLEADRIGSLQFDDKMIESERAVVLSERSTGLENDPWERLLHSMKSVAFEAHPYAFPVIGIESDIKAWTKEDLIRYFKTYYSPHNAVMVISGDIDRVKVRDMLEKKLGLIPRGEPIPTVRTIEPPQQGERRLKIIKEQSRAALFAAAFHVPETKHPDTAALELLAEILAGGPTSRLELALVDQKAIASSVLIDLPLSLDPNLFTILVTGIDGQNPLALEREVLAVLQKLKNEGVSDRELRKAKNKKINEFYRQISTINGKSELLGEFEVYLGNYEILDQAVSAYESVQAQDIKRVLNQYFQAKNRTIATQYHREP